MAKKTSRRLTIELTERTLHDINAIEKYSLKQFGKRVTDRYIKNFEAAFQRIATDPDLLREEPPFHFSLRFYRVEKHLLVCETGISGRIIILTVLHGSMDVPSRLAELEANLTLDLEMLLQQLRKSKKK